jgi:hypothetical protein
MWSFDFINPAAPKYTDQTKRKTIASSIQKRFFEKKFLSEISNINKKKIKKFKNAEIYKIIGCLFLNLISLFFSYFGY